MTSVLYIEKTIETKRFLLPNIQSRSRNFKGVVRFQEHECTNYYGEELKDPVFKYNISSSFDSIKNKKKLMNRKITLLKNIPSTPISVKSINLKKLLDFKKSKEKSQIDSKTQQSFHMKKTKNVLNLNKIDFPYTKPTIINTYTKLIFRSAKKKLSIRKNFSKGKKLF